MSAEPRGAKGRNGAGHRVRDEQGEQRRHEEAREPCWIGRGELEHGYHLQRHADHEQPHPAHGGPGDVKRNRRRESGRAGERARREREQPEGERHGERREREAHAGRRGMARAPVAQRIGGSNDEYEQRARECRGARDEHERGPGSEPEGQQRRAERERRVDGDTHGLRTCDGRRDEHRQELHPGAAHGHGEDAERDEVHCRERNRRPAARKHVAAQNEQHARGRDAEERRGHEEPPGHAEGRRLLERQTAEAHVRGMAAASASASPRRQIRIS